jgi:hypothetical protein
LGAIKVKLTAEDIKSIRQAINETELPGERYPPFHMEMLYRDTPELST